MTQQTITFNGRSAIVSFVRVRATNKAWGFYDRAIIAYQDACEPTSESMGSAAYVKAYAKQHRGRVNNVA